MTPNGNLEKQLTNKARRQRQEEIIETSMGHDAPEVGGWLVSFI